MKNRKKIIYCITKANWGGAQKYVYDLATALNPDLYDVAVLTGNDGFLVEKLKARGVRVLILGDLTRDISIFKDLWAFFKILKIFSHEKPDIVHLNSSKMGLLGALAGRILGIKKIIFTGHGWAFNEDRSKLQRKFIYWLHRLTIKLSHKTIAVSEQTKRQILGNDTDTGKIVVIKNGIGEINYLNKDLARAEISKRLPADLDIKDRRWLGTISELHKNKGLKYLIEAIHLLDTSSDDRSKLPLVIIIGEGERREKLQERINRYGLGDTIFMIGRINEAEKYLKAFDIFTLTSITEALPYVILEAGQAGIPIIASAVGGIPEIIDDLKSGILVRPKEPEEIKRAFDFLQTNTDKALLFGQNIQKKIQEEFNKEIMVKKTLELYN